MPAFAEAPRHDSHSDDTQNPFATPPIDAANAPAPPQPVAFPAGKTTTAHRWHVRPRPPLSPTSSHHDSITFPTTSASMSSSNTSATTPISSIDLEKGALGREIEAPKKQRQRSRDPEKAAAQSPTRHSRDRHAPPHTTRIAYVEEDDADDDDTKAFQEAKAVEILLYLAGPCALLSALNAFWTIISLVITIMTQPVRLCARRPTFGQQLGGLVGPALNLQLRSIYTPLPPHADEDTSYRPGMLVLVMLLSPFLSVGMALAAWVAAIFWLSSAVVGDPAGMDKRDDGRETVLVLRKWWEKWLVGSMRDD
ncbi:hypothetical protein BST61_g5337 [Cercospora zeina]